MNNLSNRQNYTKTENGALSHESTTSAVYDMFAVGGAYRNRSNEDCILLFKNALEEDEALALKTLFYLRDIRGGQGERRFFRVCFNWLAEHYPDIAERNLINVPEYGRWDDLIYSVFNTPLELNALRLIKHQLALDLESETPSLLGKWLPSENASSETTKKAGKHIRQYLHITSREYRKILSALRARINVLEKLMSEQRWDEIEFDKIPSKAGLVYRNAFMHRDELSERYRAFINSKQTTVNANLYPYEIVHKVIRDYFDFTHEDRAVLEKYWNNLPDYFNGSEESMLCVVDTSGSMYGMPLEVAISLGIYCGERSQGPFHNYYISFSREPKLVHIEGLDIMDKVQRIWRKTINENTDLIKVFSLLKSIALMPSTKREDIPKAIVIISDMQIDSGLNTSRRFWYYDSDNDSSSVRITKDNISTEMEKVRQEWEADGLEMPRLVYWNVDARGQANILDLGPNVSYVSGFSPVVFKTVLTGKSGYQLMLEVLTSDRYLNVY